MAVTYLKKYILKEIKAKQKYQSDDLHYMWKCVWNSYDLPYHSTQTVVSSSFLWVKYVRYTY